MTVQKRKKEKKKNIRSPPDIDLLFYFCLVVLKGFAILKHFLNKLLNLVLKRFFICLTHALMGTQSQSIEIKD